MWKKTLDGSIEDENGKILFFSLSRFISKIALGDCCFICGAKPGTKNFNDEHVIPAWLLRRFSLFNRHITLPNGQHLRYDSYKVPCCEECNSLLGREIETPISEALQNGAAAVNRFLANGGLKLMFVWMSLIYFKTHLRDRSLRFHLDARRGTAQIADAYNWSELHHIHAVVRSVYTGCQLGDEVLGSFISHSLDRRSFGERFHYADLYASQTIMLQLDDMALFAVLNDSGASLSRFSDRYTKITGPLSPTQAREVMVELALLNLHMKDRPSFWTESDMENMTARMSGQLPPNIELLPLKLKARGQMLRHALHDIPEEIQFIGCTREEAVEAIDAGTMTFLFDTDGRFIGDHFDAGASK